MNRMQISVAMRRAAGRAVGLALLVAAAGCGQKGPLVLAPAASPAVPSVAAGAAPAAAASAPGSTR